MSIDSPCRPSLRNNELMNFCCFFSHRRSHLNSEVYSVQCTVSLEGERVCLHRQGIPQFKYKMQFRRSSSLSEGGHTVQRTAFPGKSSPEKGDPRRRGRDGPPGPAHQDGEWCLRTSIGQQGDTALHLRRNNPFFFLFFHLLCLLFRQTRSRTIRDIGRMSLAYIASTVIYHLVCNKYTTKFTGRDISEEFTDFGLLCRSCHRLQSLHDTYSKMTR